MRLSKSFIPTLRDDPKEAEIISHKLMLRAGYIKKISSGIYSYLPLGLRVIKKIENIVRQEMDLAGALEVLLPAVQPKELWMETGRWDIYGKELMRIKDRHDREFCLGPTHEEIITELVRNNVPSYKNLPLVLYQIQTKFRDEIRPRFGLMRGREFIMKDCYSFDRDEDGLKKNYEKMFEAYSNIFKRCGLNFRIAQADPGAIGGGFSQEFMVVAKTGEDEIVYCSECSFCTTKELSNIESDNACGSCSTGVLKIERGIEVGHIFKLGTKYSSKMKAEFLDEDGIRKPFIMGCYGIGIGRTAAASIEQNNDENGIIWPLPIAPYQVAVIPVNVKETDKMNIAENIYNELLQKNVEVIIDDRDERAGIKFKDVDLIGIPIKIIIGKSLSENKVEIVLRADGRRELIDVNKAVEYVRERIGKGQ